LGLTVGMRIGFDARYLSHGLLGGIHTHVSELLPALLEAGRTHEFVIYIDAKRPFEHQLPAGVDVHVLPWHSELSTAVNDWRLPAIMGRHRLDVVHYPANHGVGPTRAATILTVHDALNLLPVRTILQSAHSVWSLRRQAQSLYLSHWTRRSVRRADAIVTISAHARDEILRYGQCDAGRLHVVPPGPPQGWVRVTDPTVLSDVRTRFSLPCRFVLADALKNPATVVDAWRRLPETVRAGRQIVFFARQPDLLPIVGDAVRAGEARVLHRPSRSDLAALYSIADAFLFPSWIEGFGLPLLEAMACGTPVVASTRGSIPEVAAGAALLADPDDSAAFAGQVQRVLVDPSVAERLRNLGLRRVRDFSWQHTASRLLDIYEGAVRERRKRPA
jgi:glycosyltransferase involved in cell wall biosynthesis